MIVTVDTSELRAFGATLARAGAAIGKANEKILTDEGGELLEAAKRDAPVRTGALRDSLSITRGDGERTVGTDLRQGFYQEFGTSRHPPQPFLFHNGDRAGNDLAEALGEAGEQLIDGGL